MQSKSANHMPAVAQMNTGFILTGFPGFAVPALLVAVPLVLAAAVLWFNGRETSGRRLEEIHDGNVKGIPAPSAALEDLIN